MDDCTCERGSDGLAFTKRSLVIRDKAVDRDQSSALCNRHGCNGKPGSSRGVLPKVPSRDGPSQSSLSSTLSRKKPSRTSFGSSSECRVPRKPLLHSGKKQSSKVEALSCESGSSHSESEGRGYLHSRGKDKTGFQDIHNEPPQGDIPSSKSGSSSIARNIRSCLNIRQKQAGNDTSDSPLCLTRKRVSSNKLGLRNIGCNSASDTVSSSSSSESNQTKKDIFRGQYPSEASSSKGKEISESSATCIPSSSTDLTSKDSRLNKSRLSSQAHDVVPTSMRRSLGAYARPRIANGEGGTSNLSTRMPSRCANARGHSSAGLERLRNSAHVGAGSTRLENLRNVRSNGFTEILLALERIEQDEEMTHEQLAILEENLFLTGLNLFDQHREMRLDIDNMSYEELLALEDKMGTVSTALPEEMLSKCIATSIHGPIPDGCGAIKTRACAKDDLKCSVCQEEYSEGEEVGRMQCGHKYHVTCIKQWLRMKNWCPVCKASAVPAESPPP